MWTVYYKVGDNKCFFKEISTVDGTIGIEWSFGTGWIFPAIQLAMVNAEVLITRQGCMFELFVGNGIDEYPVDIPPNWCRVDTSHD